MLNHELSKGISFPKARENAVLMYLNDIKRYANILSGANNILAIEYIKALRRLKSNLKPFSVQRKKCIITTNILWMILLVPLPFEKW